MHKKWRYAIAASFEAVSLLRDYGGDGISECPQRTNMLLLIQGCHYAWIELPLTELEGTRSSISELLREE